MPELAKKITASFGPEYERLNSRRLTIISKKLAEHNLSIPRETIEEYLSTIDPGILKWPFSNSTLSFPEEDASHDWFDLLDDDDPDNYLTLKKEGGQDANEITTLRSRCLIMHVLNGTPLDDLQSHVQTSLTEDTIGMAGVNGLFLPQGWLANTKRSRVKKLMERGRQLRMRVSENISNPSLDNEGILGIFIRGLNQSIENDNEETVLEIAQCLAYNPNPTTLVQKLVDVDRLRRLSEATIKNTNTRSQ